MKKMQGFGSSRILYVYLIIYAAAYYESRSGGDVISAILLIGLAAGIYLWQVARTGSLASLLGLFSLSWIAGEGLACLKLSHLQVMWETKTWICFGLAWVCFFVTYSFPELRDSFALAVEGRRGKKRGSKTAPGEAESRRVNESRGSNESRMSKETVEAKESHGSKEARETNAERGVNKSRWVNVRQRLEFTGSAIDEERIVRAITAITVIAGLAILVEWIAVGFLPILSDMPHAYSYFHVSGVHYFAVLFVLIPSLTIIYYHLAWERSRRQDGKKEVSPMQVVRRLPKRILICNVLAVIYPLLLVSRFQLFFTLLLAVMTWLLINNRLRFRFLVLLFVVLVAGWVFLTVYRHHDVTYLNGIFEMKDARTPIFVSQPYIYITNNYDNFNQMVRDLSAHSLGLKMLFPIIALSGMKFVFPQLVSQPVFVTKTELTTLTLFYDAYYDFGVIGVILLAAVLGSVCRHLEERMLAKREPIIVLFGAQMAMYLLLSFFTTWFSNPTTWFYFAATAAIFWYVGRRKSND